MSIMVVYLDYFDTFVHNCVLYKSVKENNFNLCILPPAGGAEIGFVEEGGEVSSQPEPARRSTVLTWINGW